MPALSNCPACLGSRTRRLFEITSNDAAQFLVIREGPYRERHDALVGLIEKRWAGPTCEMRQCEDCGFGFAAPFVSGDAEFYNLAYPTVAYPRMKWEFARTLKALENNTSKGMRALEVAAGHGFFLDLCVPNVFEAGDISATEFNAECISVLKQKGYSAIQSDIREPSFNDVCGQIDFLFLFQVVEHLDNVDSLFARLSQMLTQQGSVFIAVPSVRWIDYRERSGSLRDLPPTHIGRWTPEAFASIASRHGLEVTDHEFEPFSLRKFIFDDLVFSHFERAHQPDSFANRARALKSNNARFFAEAFEMITFAPSRFRPIASGISRGTAMGGAALWVQLRHNRS